jgi:putative sterol carrier protein
MPEPVNSDPGQLVPALKGEYTVPSLEGVHGRVEFLGPGGHVFVTIDDGKVELSPTNGAVDCTLKSDIPGELLRLVRGESNLVTALLQGRIEATGDPMLIVEIAGCMPELGDELRAHAGEGR